MDAIWKLANSHLRDLAVYEPGKPIEETARECGLRPEQIVKLASNENPLGPSSSVRAAMHEALGGAHLYPDGSGFYLRAALAEKLNISPQCLVFGNGSNEIIEFVGHAFLRPGTEMVTSENAFVAYRLVAALLGATVVQVPDQEFRFDLEGILRSLTPRTRVIFIANPNNPTGTLVDQRMIDSFMEKVPDEVVVVFDEAYYEYLDDPPDTLQFVRAGRNVVVLRTFSKIHALANIRLGYGVARAELTHVLQRTRQPFNTSGVAQAGAIAALSDKAHQAESKRVTDEGRQYLEHEFAEMGLTFVPSVANFVLVNVGDGKAIFRALLREGVIVRALGGYNLPEWVRVSVGTKDENRQCITVLRRVLA